MKTLQLYTLEDTDRDRAAGIPGLECSIFKWESILSIVNEILSVAQGSCGLCREYLNCSKCPLAMAEGVSCKTPFSSFHKVFSEGENLREKIIGLLQRLNSLKEDNHEPIRTSGPYSEAG